MSCLGDNTIGAFVEGKLPAEEALSVKEHLSQCPECREVVRGVIGSTARSSALSGEVILDTYRVGPLLGSGAMGMVYAGEHIRLTRQVAIKLLGDALRGHPEALERFRREAQVCSRLGSPHIVDVLDFNTLPDGTPFMVMERLEGEDLAQRLSMDGAMAPWLVVRLLRQICAALATAHEEGVLHRDLKPSNIFLCPPETGDVPLVKVLDFGISKVRGALATLTGSQEILGTPYYMSPEMAQARHDQVDHRSDLFSLGAIAYEALACRRAFEADSIPGALYRIVHEAPEPLEQVNPAVPRPLALLVGQLLAKLPDQRPASAREVIERLDALQLPERPRQHRVSAEALAATVAADTSTLKTGRGAPLRRALLVGAGGAVLLVGLLIWGPWRPSEPEAAAGAGGVVKGVGTAATAAPDAGDPTPPDGALAQQRLDAGAQRADATTASAGLRRAAARSGRGHVGPGRRRGKAVRGRRPATSSGRGKPARTKTPAGKPNKPDNLDTDPIL